MKLKNSRYFAALAVLLMAAFVGVAFGGQPDKWVRYVESTGSQYVDTGVRARWGTKAEMKVEWTAFADTSFLAARGADGGNTRLYFCHCGGENSEILAGFTTWSYLAYNGWRGRYEPNRVYTIVNEFTSPDANNMVTNIVTIDGLKMSCIDSSSAAVTMVREKLDAGCSLYLFACNKGGTAVAKSKARCYGLKIWQDGYLVRDFQPCMKDGKAALYDAKNDTFYFGSGGDLVCDPNSEVPDEEIDYVESHGNDAYEYSDGQIPGYIDTGIIGKSGTKVVGEFALLDNADGCLVGSRSGSTRFYMLHSYYTRIACGYNLFHDNSYKCQLGKRYWVETEFNAGSQTERIWADGVTNTLYSASEGAVDTGLPMYLFTCNVNGNPYLDKSSSMSGKARCYGLKIWQNDSNGVSQLVRNYKPCLKNGVAGLYDTVSGRIYYSLGTPFNFDNTKPAKEKDVIFVEYIESDGNNTLDTGVLARSGLRAKGEMAWMTAGDYGNGQLRIWNHEAYRYLEETPAVFWRQKRAYLASRNIRNSSKYFQLIHESDSKLKAQYGGSGEMSPKNSGADVTLYAGSNCTFDVTFANGSQTVEWNGVQVLNESVAGDVDTGDTLHLFSSSYWRWRSAARCYGLEIWQNGTKVRNFRPCIYEGKGMLYDTETKKVYQPSPSIPLSRTGPIVLSGNEKPAAYVDYVETDGTQFIDTCVTGRYDTVVEFAMAWRCTPDASPMTYERSFLGSRLDTSTDTRFFTWFTSYNRLVYAYGNYRYVNANDPTTWTTYKDGNPFVWVTADQVYHGLVSFSSAAQTVQVIENGVTNTLQNITSYNNSIDSQMPMYLFGVNIAGEVWYSSDVRFYWLKIKQDGNLVRDFKPVRLRDGSVAIWDFVENKPYFPRSVGAPHDYKAFSAVGPDGYLIRDGMSLIIR